MQILIDSSVGGITHLKTTTRLSGFQFLSKFTRYVLLSQYKTVAELVNAKKTVDCVSRLL